MKESDISELMKPPDFESRAEAFLDKLGRIRDDIGLLFAENRTQALPRILQGGLSFLGAENYSVLRKATEEYQDTLDIESATQNEVEAIISSGSKAYLGEAIKIVDQVAAEFDGIRINEPDVYFSDGEEESDIHAVLSFRFYQNKVPGTV